MSPAVIELRQYTLKPGRRDDLIDLFEREFVETQEACGMTVIGQFSDLDDPDRFVWLRGFPDMAARLGALKAFYTGPAWRAHRNDANATMIHSDDVLLLRPLNDASGFGSGGRGPPATAGQDSPGVVVCGVHRLTGEGDPLVECFRVELAPRLSEVGLTPAAVLHTHAGPNDFPGLPVREGETVLVWFAILPDRERADTALAAARRTPELGELFDGPLQIMRLQPTARSRLYG